MSVVVISCGRTGINLAVTLLSTNSKLNPENPIENKDFFKQNKLYQKNYLCKVDVTYSSNYNELDVEQAIEEYVKKHDINYKTSSDGDITHKFWFVK